ncbi:MAG: peptidoglycan DD-metalloendopeptidase family protein [Candidatus Accumulibacter sp.]|jgi:lipoprotein NlpD|nr:peptidoglycan DD-metalloendopeptidase family protein [Accumulibacter sp.]
MKKMACFSGVGYAALAILALVLSACTSNVPAPVAEWSGQSVPAPAARVGTHTVKAGDTLYSIAREYGMDFRELIALNGIENPDQLSVGRVLKIGPRADSAATPGAVAAPVPPDVVVVRPIGEAPVVARRPEAEGNTDRVKRLPKAGKAPYSEQALALALNDGKPPPPPVEAAKPPEPAKPAESPVVKPAEAAASAGARPWIWPASGKLVGTFSESGSKGIDIAGKSGDPVIAAGGGKVVYSGTGLPAYGKLVIIKHNAEFLSAYAHNQKILVKENQSVTQGQKIAEMGNTGANQVKLHFEVRRQGKAVDPLKHLPPR